MQSMNNYRAHTPQNLALAKILLKFRKTSIPLGIAVPLPRLTLVTSVDVFKCTKTLIGVFFHNSPQIRRVEQ